MGTPSMSDLSGAYLETVPGNTRARTKGRPTPIWDSPGDSSMGDASAFGRYEGPGYGGLGSCCGGPASAGWNAGLGDACCASCAKGGPCSGGDPITKGLADLGEAVAVSVRKISNFFADPRGGFVPARGRARRARAPGAMIGLSDLGQATQHFELPGESGQKPVNLNCAGGSNITVQQATYGRNCNKPALIGNKTSVFAALCNGKSSCSGVTQAITDPDPAVGCPKSFDIDWSCDGPSSGVTTASLPPPSPTGPSSSVTTASAPPPPPPPPSAPLFAPAPSAPAPSAASDNSALKNLQQQISALQSQPAAQPLAPLVSQVPFLVQAPSAPGPTGGSFLSPSDFPPAAPAGITSQPWFLPAAVGAGLLVLFLATRKQSPVVIAKNWLR